MQSEAFDALVGKVLPVLNPVPIVSPDEYRQITCNRCGLCCVDFRSRDTPEELQRRIADPATDPDRRRFLSGLEPVEQLPDGWRYDCRYFSRDAQGNGLCAIHATRPNVCRSFPYGLVVRSWRECAWYVEVRDADGDIVPVVDALPPEFAPVNVV